MYAYLLILQTPTSSIHSTLDAIHSQKLYRLHQLLYGFSGPLQLSLCIFKFTIANVCTVKKVSHIPPAARMSLTKLSLAGKIKV
jgi:hypothetical protein